MLDIDIESFNKTNHKIVCYRYLKMKEDYLNLPKGFPLIGVGKLDKAPYMFLALKGLKRLAIKKYGVYNTCIDGKNTKMFFKCFSWLQY